MAKKPTFIDSDPQKVLQELISDYEQRTGRTLQPAQAERLVINSVAYAISLFKEQANEAALQNLVEFADAPALDRLGDLVGVVRLQASKATTTMQFTLVDGHGGVTIPQGTRVASIDNQIIFQTTTELEVIAGVNTAEVAAAASVAGAAANGVSAGSLVNILDPQSFLSSAQNTTTTAGGADIETDDALRDRIKLAPSQFSTAGSVDSYVFHSKTASATIIDVGVTNPAPGVVNVYPMILGGGTTPAEILQDVEDALTSERVRPLTDTVNVLSPTTIFYAIEVELTLYADAVLSDTTQEVEGNLNAYVAEQSAGLGNDIIVNQIIGACTASEGVYQVNVIAPASDIVVDETSAGISTGITITVTGTNEG